jgi:hypothetical protein
MDEEEVVVAVSFFIAAAVSIKIIASAFLKHWENKLKYGSSMSQGGLRDGELSARMERIEQALDSIAVEVERISENQRYTPKLLAEREGVPARGRLSS